MCLFQQKEGTSLVLEPKSSDVRWQCRSRHLPARAERCGGARPIIKAATGVGLWPIGTAVRAAGSSDATCRLSSPAFPVVAAGA